MIEGESKGVCKRVGRRSTRARGVVFVADLLIDFAYDDTIQRP